MPPAQRINNPQVEIQLAPQVRDPICQTTLARQIKQHRTQVHPAKQVRRIILPQPPQPIHQTPAPH